MANQRLSPEEVFHQARAIEAPGERAGYLRGACGDDLALRSKVDALLAADAEAGLFLASGSQESGASEAAPPQEQVGATIDRYKLLQKIGEGGFGVVYMAELRPRQIESLAFCATQRSAARARLGVAWFFDGLPAVRYPVRRFPRFPRFRRFRRFRREVSGARQSRTSTPSEVR